MKYLNTFGSKAGAPPMLVNNMSISLFNASMLFCLRGILPKAWVDMDMGLDFGNGACKKSVGIKSPAEAK